MAYEDLLAIYDEAYELAAQQQMEEPYQCPNDGTVLLKNEAGELRCRFDGWVWNGINK